MFSLSLSELNGLKFELGNKAKYQDLEPKLSGLAFHLRGTRTAQSYTAYSIISFKSRVGRAVIRALVLIPSEQAMKPPI